MEFRNYSSNFEHDEIGTLPSHFDPSRLNWKEANWGTVLAARNEANQSLQMNDAASKPLLPVVNWIEQHKDSLSINSDGLMSRTELNHSLSDPRFKDEQSQKYLHFLQDNFALLSTTKCHRDAGYILGRPGRYGVPTEMQDLAEIMDWTKSETSLRNRITTSSTKWGGVIGLAATGSFVASDAADLLPWQTKAVVVGGGILVGAAIGWLKGNKDYHQYKTDYSKLIHDLSLL